MKTALDLPDELMKEVKFRAVRDGRKLKDEIADLLRRGLDTPSESVQPVLAGVERDSRSGLPVVTCARPKARGRDLSPSRLANILLQQETAWNHEAGR